MVERKHYKLFFILAFLILANITNAFFGIESTLEYKMLDALEDHQHENAFKLAGDLLQQQPDHEKAAQIYIQSGQILFDLQQAQQLLPDYRSAVDEQSGEVIFYVAQDAVATQQVQSVKQIVQTQQVYEKFKQARMYTDKAKLLDPRFKTTLQLEYHLDLAQTYVLQLLAGNVLSKGEEVYSAVRQNFQSKSALVKAADNSLYLQKFLAVQSSWAPMSISTKEISQQIGPLLESIIKTNALIADYKAGKAEQLSAALVRYIQALQFLQDQLLMPSGSYQEFIVAAQQSNREYIKAHKRLTKMFKIRKTSSTYFSELLRNVSQYPIFTKPEVSRLIQNSSQFQRLNTPEA